MLQKQRHEKILRQLEISHAVKVTELAKELNISESTIRRDIIELDKAGKLKKVFGGAVPAVTSMVSAYTDVAERDLISTEEKDRIAKYAATLIEDDDFVYIDAGTTTHRMIDYLENKNATYVTNGIAHAEKLVQRGFDVYMIGGMLRPMTEAAVGASAIESLKRYNFTKCFMGTNGIDIRGGFSTPHISEGAMKTAAIQNSCISYILADHTKFGRLSSVTFAGLDEAYIITDRVENEVYLEVAQIKQIV